MIHYGMTFDAVGVFYPDFWLLFKSGLSYCGSQTPDPIYDFTDMTAEELAENHVETPSRPDYEEAIKPENDWKILIPQKRMDKIAKRNQKKNDWYNNCSIYRADTSFASTSEAPTEASLNTTGKLEILRRKMPKKSSPVKGSFFYR